MGCRANDYGAVGLDLRDGEAEVNYRKNWEIRIPGQYFLIFPYCGSNATTQSNQSRTFPDFIESGCQDVDFAGSSCI